MAIARTFHVPRERWMSVLKLIDQKAADRPFRLEAIGRTLGDQELGDLLPFRGLDYDSKGTEAGTLTIAGGTGEGEYTHRIHDPTEIYIGLDELGVMKWLAIEEESGKTIVHFQDLPELEAGLFG